jgi:hypothetical protein
MEVLEQAIIIALSHVCTNKQMYECEEINHQYIKMSKPSQLYLCDLLPFNHSNLPRREKARVKPNAMASSLPSNQYAVTFEIREGDQMNRKNHQSNPRRDLILDNAETGVASYKCRPVQAQTNGRQKQRQRETRMKYPT